jgi:hypothetical protein
MPTGNGQTDFSAWFYAPELGRWQHIASFQRPQTDTHLTSPHSFLENFLPSTGNIDRMARFSRQWLEDTEGAWHPIRAARFTTDATGNAKARLDFDGGTVGDAFYLRNCGFFTTSESVVGRILERPADDAPPAIDTSTLPRGGRQVLRDDGIIWRHTARPCLRRSQSPRGRGRDADRCRRQRQRDGK